MYYFTRHSLEKMDGLGVSKEEVKQIIMQGMKWKEQLVEKWHAQMMGIEVVFTKEDGVVTIITVYRTGGKQ